VPPEPGEGAPWAAAGTPRGESDLVTVVFLGFGVTFFGRAFRCTFFAFRCTTGFAEEAGGGLLGREDGAGRDVGRGAGDRGLGWGFGCGFGVGFGFGGAGSGAGSVVTGVLVVGGGSSAQAGEVPAAATAATSTQAASTRPRRAKFPPPR